MAVSLFGYYIVTSRMNTLQYNQNSLSQISSVSLSPNDKTISLKKGNVRYDISLVGGGVKNIYRQHTRHASSIKEPTDVTVRSLDGRSSLVSDNYHYTATMEDPYGVKENEYIASQGFQVISSDPKVTFGKYSVVSLTEDSVYLQLSLEKGTIHKKIYIDTKNETPSIFCDVKYSGFENEDLWISSGMPASDLIMNKSYNSILYNEVDVNDDSLSKTYKISAPSSGDSTTNANRISWIANRSGMYSIILDAENPSSVSGLKTFAVKSSQFKDPTFKDTSYITALKLSKPAARFRLTSAECSKSFLNSLKDIRGNEGKYTDIEKVNNIFGLIINPVLGLIHYIANFGHKLTGSWSFGVIFLLTSFLAFSFITKPISNRLSRKAKEHIENIKRMDAWAKSGKISYEEFAIRAKKGLSESKWSILASITFPLIRLFIVIAMAIFFRFSFELRGVSLIPRWIDDLSKPDEVMFISSIPLIGSMSIRILPIIVGFSTIMRSGNAMGQNVPKVFKNFIMPITITYMLYDMPSGFQIYFIVSSFVIGESLFKRSEKTKT